MQPLSSNDGENSFDRSILTRIAQSVHTLDVIDAQSRALIVFNVSECTISQTARFVSEVTWDTSSQFPGVCITTWSGEEVASAITDLRAEPDSKGRAGKVRLTFNLDFHVSALEGRSWQTFIARFGSTSDEAQPMRLGEPHPSFVVLEAEAQRGELSPAGTL